MTVNLNLCRSETPKQVLFSCSEEPDERLHNVAFNQGLQCLLQQNQSSKNEILISPECLHIRQDIFGHGQFGQ